MKTSNVYDAISDLLERGKTEIETEYGTIEIEVSNYHRGIIPIIKGVILLNTSSKLEDYILDYLNAYPIEFASTYTEYLYPGSPDYGFNLRVEYIDYDDEDIDNLIEDYDIKVSRSKVKNTIDKINTKIGRIEYFLYDFYDLFDKELRYYLFENED